MKSCHLVFYRYFLFLLTLTANSHGFAGTPPSSQSSAQSPKPQPIPITVLSGFLGSGKTTLLQYLLNNPDGLRIAVIVNDVAEVNIDQKLIQGNTCSPTYVEGEIQKPAGLIELSNGCGESEIFFKCFYFVLGSTLKSSHTDFHLFWHGRSMFTIYLKPVAQLRMSYCPVSLNSLLSLI